MDNNFGFELNPQYKPLWEKLRALLLVKEINPRVIPHKIKWAKAFVNSLKDKPLIKADFKDIKAFLHNLESDKAILPYQIQQAKDSIFIFFAEVLEHPLALNWNQEFSGKKTSPLYSNQEPNILAEVCKTHENIIGKTRNAIRTMHYSIRTEKNYLNWIKRFLCFHHPIDIAQLKPQQVADFLEYLAVERDVAAATQNQARMSMTCAILSPSAKEKAPKTGWRRFPKNSKRN